MVNALSVGAGELLLQVGLWVVFTSKLTIDTKTIAKGTLTPPLFVLLRDIVNFGVACQQP